MKKEQFIELMDEKLKLIRTEYGLSQDKMALVLGISKKTLVEIEKGRKTLGWTAAVALSSIFSDSSLLTDSLGGSASEIIIALAFKDIPVTYPRTWGGKIWWKTIEIHNGFQVQQNIISRHYRILDKENKRIYASFYLEEIEALIRKLKNTSYK